MKDNGYTNKISHAGTQKVEAPVSNKSKKGTTIKKTGKDLRCK